MCMCVFAYVFAQQYLAGDLAFFTHKFFLKIRLTAEMTMCELTTEPTFEKFSFSDV